MYVARFGAAYIIKRMPYTGSQHVPACPSYELPTELQDGEAAASAVTEDPETGLTTVRLGFALSRWDGRSVTRTPGQQCDSLSSNRPTLDLAGLLRYLWNRAELNRWQPGFAGKRNWAVVRKLLLSAAASSVVRGDPLQKWLFVPETFAVERGDEIRNRRSVQWAADATRASGLRRLLLLCGEVKELAPARHGHLAIIKHMPDQPFAIDGQLFARLERRFERALSLWSGADGTHLIMLATFGLNSAGVPSIDQLTVMSVNEQWIPLKDTFEARLLHELARGQRRFIKILSRTAQTDGDHPSVALTDAGDRPVLLHISTDAFGVVSDGAVTRRQPEPDQWVWHVNAYPMPALPAAVKRSTGELATLT
jgi:hypothetical protein